ncbi:hypothetical protein DI005_16685 [Prauserella sp. PE36]|uniref:DUF427 domain-containing protein n=1 Tax=Prauserella sp. PE36 TaxID=1504709 RepID=UPI000D80EDFC|nr:DUF427 domain-containing protein [Prauserella sp. PE36]PXY34907.1 hypothetical protein BAY59_05340 [Prauserella coralliicola]RBM19316.1 hypothetical protein DI005_16685 [Prauserella sp. PE36]
MSTESRGRVRTERGAKRVRAVFAGKVVADTTRPLLVWEVPYYPTYYFPREDVRAELIVPTGQTRRSPSRGEGRVSTLRVGEREAIDAVTDYPESPLDELRDHVRLDWDAMDAWFEEDEEVYVHPRDPHTRIDILPSSRHVRIEVNGVTVADSRSPKLLFETGLPTRYYLPKVDVRLDLLEPSDRVTRCPYKGDTQYFSVRAGDELVPDLAWTYRTPLPESERIAGLIAFTDELVDVYVDGKLQERPKTKFA